MTISSGDRWAAAVRLLFDSHHKDCPYSEPVAADEPPAPHPAQCSFCRSLAQPQKVLDSQA
jgi:hypothetical protein